MTRQEAGGSFQGVIKQSVQLPALRLLPEGLQALGLAVFETDHSCRRASIGFIFAARVAG